MAHTWLKPAGIAMAMAMAMALSACDGSSDRRLPGGGEEPPPPPEGTMALGVTESNALIRFAVNDTATVEEIGLIALNGGENVVGLDIRPAGGALFAVTSDGRLLQLDPETAAVTQITADIVPGAAMLDGDRFGVDFNPAANALRVVSDNRQNLRIAPAALPPNDGAAAIVDRRLGYMQGLVAAAYTNPDGPTARPADGTALFVIDTEGELHTQDANDGLLTRVGPLGLGADDRVVDYAIVESAPTINEHYVITENGGATTLHRLDPATGAASVVAALPAGDHIGMVAETVPGEADLRFLGILTTSGDGFVVNALVLDISDDSVTLDSTLPVNGLDGKTVVGVDLRTTELADLDVGYAVTSDGMIYSLNDDADPATAIIATEVATLSGASLEGQRFGVDFNPRADLLRIVSDVGQNLRVNLQADRVIMDEARAAGFAFVDGRVRLGDPAPQIVTTAYRAAPLNIEGAIPSLDFQYALDARNSTLVRVAVPNDGALVEVGPLGVDLEANGPNAAAAGLDISGPDDTAYAVIRSGGATSSTLYQINLSTGAAMELGVIADEALTAIAVIPDEVD